MLDVSVGVWERVAAPLGVPDVLAVLVPVGVASPVGLPDPLTVPLPDPLLRADALPDMLGVPVTDVVPEEEGETLRDGVGLELGVAVRVSLCVCVAVQLALDVPVPLGVLLADPVWLGLPDPDVVPDSEAVCVPEGSPLGDPEALREPVSLAELERDAVAEGLVDRVPEADRVPEPV